MIKRAKNAGLVPAIVVSMVLAISLIFPASANRLGALTTGCGYGYGYPANSAPTVTSVAPNFGPTTGGTSVTITGSGFCAGITAVNFGATAATSFTLVSDTSATAVSPAHAAGTVDVRVTTPKGTSPTNAGDRFTFVAPALTACSTNQYRLTGSNGSRWVTMDAANLSVGFTPSVDSLAMFGGNADLFTANAGFNQDLGVTVVGGTSPSYPGTAGQPEGWKESGGFAGTFSPNAAFVQTVIPVSAGQAYAASLQWKANRADTGTIFAGAGPISGRFSPTCLTVQLIPTSAGVLTSKASTSQYHLINSNGATWQDIDGTNLSASFTAPANGTILVSGNADLWTMNAGFNQDLGVTVAGPGFPTTAGQPEAWKESGGFAGTFSPNAAFVQAALPVANGASYTIKLQWKTNHSGTSQIMAGAGPIGGRFSPTRLTVMFFATAAAPIDKVSRLQYSLPSSNGSTWQAIDPFKFTLLFRPGSDCQVFVGANADLWTANAGFNQDIGIVVIDTTFPTFPAQPEGWKESGGFNGTFSPNAAFLQTVVSLTGGQTYSFQLVWKANKPASGATIYAGAGPIAGKFSPTRLTLVPLGC